MPDSVGNKKVKHSLVALGSAAVLAVYTAGYERTRVAADRIALQAAERRPVVPGPASSVVSAPAESVNEAPTVLTPRVTDASAATPVTAPLPQAAPTAERDAVAIDTASRSPRPPEAASPAPADVNPLRSVAPIEASPAPSPALPASPEPQVSAPSPSTERADVTSAAAPTTPPAAVTVASLYKDGTYAGWGSCRHGTIEATIVIAAGRIESARISQCRTRYSCSWIADLPGQVIARQSPEVDYVSGATQSVDAFYYAVAEALSKAK